MKRQDRARMHSKILRFFKGDLLRAVEHQFGGFDNRIGTRLDRGRVDGVCLRAFQPQQNRFDAAVPATRRGQRAVQAHLHTLGLRQQTTLM